MNHLPSPISGITRAVAMIVLMAQLSIQAYAVGNTGNITGLVVDSHRAALPGATVTAAGKSVTTDSLGRYTLADIKVGTQTVTAAKNLYEPASTSVYVSRKATATAPTLQLNSGSVTGVVTSSGTAIAGATITVAGTSISAVTNSTGAYTIAQLPSGPQTLTASASGYSPASQSVGVPAGQSITVNFALTPQSGIAPGSTIPWKGGSWYLSGNNYAWWNYGTDFGTGGWGKYTDWAQIANQFAAMKSQGVNVARWFVFADGRYSPDFNADGTISGLDSSVFSDLDKAMSIAAANNIYLLFCLVDFHMWQGTVSSNGVTGGGHAAMVTSSTVQQTYLDNALKPFLQHVSASANKNAVLGYDIVNEPEWTITETWNGALPLSQVQAFVRNCASYIHSYGGGAYATVGAGTPYWAVNWKGMGLDFYQVHYYPNYDRNGPGSGLPTYASLALDKPCIVGEYPTGGNTDYNIGSTAVLSAQWYLDSIYGKGYAGALGWGFQNMDSSSNWTSFQPVFTNWVQAHSSFVGPK